MTGSLSVDSYSRNTAKGVAGDCTVVNAVENTVQSAWSLQETPAWQCVAAVLMPVVGAMSIDQKATALYSICVMR